MRVKTCVKERDDTQTHTDAVVVSADTDCFKGDNKLEDTTVAAVAQNTHY